MQRETRYMAAEIRAEKTETGRTIVGYTAVFNSKSENLGGFVEVLAPTAFDRAMKEGHDVRALIEHDPRAGILGRTTAGTLRLSTDKRGLKVEIDAPETRAAQDLLISIDRGDVDGMSFSFLIGPDGDTWEEGDDGGAVRTVHDIAELLDVSPVAYPAYTSTQVSARALEQVEKLHAESRGVPLEVYRLKQRILGWF